MASDAFHRFSHGHQDLVLAISYNFYGNRMATASSDHRVKVWDRDDKTGQWNVIDNWIAHDAEVTDAKWNGPFVGTHLATIGEDGLLKVWEENVTEAINSGRRFKLSAQKTTSTGAPFMSLEFKNIGIETYLAAVTRDGHLSILEPEDQDDLSNWRLLWAESLVKHSSRSEETGFRVSWHKEKLPAWPAVLAGLDRKSLSLAVSVGKDVRIYRTDRERRFYIAAVLDGAKDLVRDVSWANGSMRGHDLIATASKDGFLRLYELHTPGAASLSTSSAGQSAGSGVESAQTASSRPVPSGIGAGLASTTRGRKDDNVAASHGALKQEVKLLAELESHAGTPWRIDWSQMGDILVSTGDDGIIRLWKRAVDGKWLETTEIDATRHS